MNSKTLKTLTRCLVLLLLITNSTAHGEPQKQTNERVTILSGEWKLIGDFVLPQSDTPMAVVVLLNKAAGDRTAYVHLSEQLSKQGIGSLRIDLRGHGESTNLGRFVPTEGTTILKDTERDVAAVHEWLRKDKRVDPKRIGFVGASYSGESMMQAAKISGYGAAYVGLSPGSLSEESITLIDRERLTWLLVVARHERYLTEVAKTFREKSKTGEFLELSGTAHATDLLDSHRDLAERLAVWFRNKL